MQELGPGKFEVVAPSVSILAEPPVAVVDKIAGKHGTRAVAQAYLEYLYSEAGQEIAARHFYRPRMPSVAAKYQGQFTGDPGHDFNDVFMQMYGVPFDGVSGRTPTMTGFVKSYEQQAGADAGPNVMRCFRPEQLPVVSGLARQYAICDQWFS